MTENTPPVHLIEMADCYLHFLSVNLETRRMGSAGNHAATDFCGRVIASAGFELKTPGFKCLDWVTQGATCRAGTKNYTVHSSPYSNGCKVSAPLRVAGNMEELYFLDCRGAILLLKDDLTREQLMPKDYPFYNPEPHQRIVALLEEKAPAAIIAATTRNPDLAGALYPFPLIEDGKFDIPSVYTTDKVGARLAQLEGQTIHVISQAERIPSTGVNVIGRLNPFAAEKIVICAHVDTKPDTPGALDNASGVVTLLLLAELLKDYEGQYGIELLVMNGEDYYGANGEILYLDQNEGQLNNIKLFINMDALGYIKGKTAFSFYNLMKETTVKLLDVVDQYSGALEGEPWYQGDHSIVVMKGAPAVAVTSECFIEITKKYTHTTRDVPALVDTRKLVEAALTIKDMILALSDAEE